MQFSEKLDLLMNLTRTTNSLLARGISLDPSFISRLRRGMRSPAPSANYIQAMAEYLSRRCNADYQQTALGDAIKSSSALRPEDYESVSGLVYAWLREEPAAKRNAVENFLEGVVEFKFKRAPAPVLDLADYPPIGGSDIEVLHGVEGKRQAVITFLSLVLASRQPQTLLLYSNEDLGWLTDDPHFTLQWSALLEKVIRTGNRIKIVHTVNRSMDEMLSAIAQWVPMYMTGSIEPYYYPKTRDRLLRRTLFIAPEAAAVASTTLGSGTKNALNFIHTDKNTINALIEEFDEFLSLCRPLMSILTPFRKGDYLSFLSEFEDEGANRIIKSDGLSTITMPPDVAASLLARVQSPNALLEYQLNRAQKFESSLARFSFTEIASLPEPGTVKTVPVPVHCFDLTGDNGLFYTPQEFSLHLQNIIRLLKTYDNFDMHFSIKRNLEGCMVDVKEDVGVLVGKTSPPPVIFALNESNLTAAFWDYMMIYGKNPVQGQRKKDTALARLTALVENLGV